jgi:hypothetical protein
MMLCLSFDRNIKRLAVGVAIAALTSAIPASASTSINYKILATIIETRYSNTNSPNPITEVFNYGPAVYEFNFDVNAPHQELFGDFMHYGMFATVEGATLSFKSGDAYPGYGGLNIVLNFDHDLLGKLPVGEQPTSLSWFEGSGGANGSQTFVGTDLQLLSVPEPSTWALMLSGFGMIGFATRRRQAIKTTIRYA